MAAHAAGEAASLGDTDDVYLLARRKQGDIELVSHTHRGAGLRRDLSQIPQRRCVFQVAELWLRQSFGLHVADLDRFVSVSLDALDLGNLAWPDRKYCGSNHFALLVYDASHGYLAPEQRLDHRPVLIA
jgi:hypothetical protein